MHIQRTALPNLTPRRRGAKAWLGVVLLVAVAAFIAGYKMRPRLTVETWQSVWAKYVERQPSHKSRTGDPAIPEVMGTDFNRLIQLRTAGEVESRRRQAIEYIWRGKSVGWGDVRPDQVERDVFFAPLEDLTAVESIDRLVVTLPFGITSEVFHLKPKKRRSCLMLYQEGHRVSFLERRRFLKRLVAEGCDVLALSFPLTGGINNRPEIDHPRFGRLLMNDPDDLQLVDSASDSFLYYFLAPLVASLNHALAENQFDRVGATGFSGGGWAVAILAALEPRIQASYSVAGSAPIGVHAARPGWGSPEQRDARFYEIATYTELYVMGAAGEGRRQTQIVNVTDPCCFSGTYWAAYGAVVAQRVRELGGRFRMLTYEDSAHQLSKPVSLAILDDFVDGGAILPQGVREVRQ